MLFPMRTSSWCSLSGHKLPSIKMASPILCDSSYSMAAGLRGWPLLRSHKKHRRWWHLQPQAADGLVPLTNSHPVAILLMECLQIIKKKSKFFSENEIYFMSIDADIVSSMLFCSLKQHDNKFLSIKLQQIQFLHILYIKCSAQILEVTKIHYRNHCQFTWALFISMSTKNLCSKIIHM